VLGGADGRDLPTTIPVVEHGRATEVSVALRNASRKSIAYRSIFSLGREASDAVTDNGRMSRG